MLCALQFLIGAGLLAGCGQPSPDSQVLPFPLQAACESAGVSPVRSAIVAKLGALVPDAGKIEIWDRLISQLGDGEFVKREEASLLLMIQGPALKGRLLAARSSVDPEISRRADEISQSLPFRQQEAWLESAVAWLAETPDNFLQNWLIAYLPWVEQTAPSHTSRWLVQRLLECSTKLNDWEWVNQINSGSAPLLRLAASQSPLGLPETQIAGGIRTEVAQERDARVRFEQTKRKFPSRTAEVVRELAQLLLVLPEGEAMEAEEMLQRIGGPNANGRVLLGGLEGKLNREPCSKAWLGWLEKPGVLESWKTLSPDQNSSASAATDRTLVVEFDGPRGGRIQELDKNWKPLWSMEGLAGPNDVQFLPGGNLLIAERTGCRVTERTPSGQVCWEHTLVVGPISAVRTPFGTTVIATFHEVIEIDSVGREIRKHTHSSGFREVKGTPEGNLRCVTGDGNIQLLDPSWKLLEILKPERHGQGAAYWASVRSLGPDRLLVSLGGTGKIVEIDGRGKIIWEASVPAAVHSQRLANGNTLVCSFDGRALVEIDANGKEVGKLPLEGRPFMALKR